MLSLALLSTGVNRTLPTLHRPQQFIRQFIHSIILVETAVDDDLDDLEIQIVGAFVSPMYLLSKLLSLNTLIDYPSFLSPAVPRLISNATSRSNEKLTLTANPAHHGPPTWPCHEQHLIHDSRYGDIETLAPRMTTSYQPNPAIPNTTQPQPQPIFIYNFFIANNTLSTYGVQYASDLPTVALRAGQSVTKPSLPGHR